MDEVFVAFMLVGLFINLWISSWVYSDAKSRGKSVGVALFWFVATFLLLIVFLPLWLIMRPTPTMNNNLNLWGKPKLCADCGKYYDNNPSFCPNCGMKLVIDASQSELEPKKFWTTEQEEFAKAIYNADKAKIDKYLSEGVDINTPNEHGVTILQYANNCENKVIIEMLNKAHHKFQGGSNEKNVL